MLQAVGPEGKTGAPGTCIRAPDAVLAGSGWKWLRIPFARKERL